MAFSFLSILLIFYIFNTSYFKSDNYLGIMGGPRYVLNMDYYSKNQVFLTNNLFRNYNSPTIQNINTELALLNNNFKNQPEGDVLNGINFDKKDLGNNFILPVFGFNWGRIHPKNAVDIAASCGEDVVASKSGLVIDLADFGWNKGYGKYIKIEHLDNTKTIYAHLRSVSVSLGEYVDQGKKIGEVGETGQATGCHLHFEVVGAKNPFVKN